MQRGYRSLFWPILLIGIGVLWLLANLGVIQPINILALLRLWPILLIVIGLDLLIGRKSAMVGGLIGLIAVAAVVVLLLFGKTLGINAPAGTKTERFVDPIGQATSANIDLYLAERHSDIKALNSSTDLFDATLTHPGTIDFVTTGTTERNIRLSQTMDANWAIMDITPGDWQIGLSPNLPIDLTIDGGSGSNEFDFSGLNLTDLKMDMGSGSTIVTLPAGPEAYQAEIESGSGSIKINLVETGNLSLLTNSGSGSVNIPLPAGAAVRVNVRDNGSGSLNIKGDLQWISGDDENGLWQTQGYETAEYKIEITINGRGSGSVTIH